MKKIISLFQRNYVNGLVSDEVTPGAEWVIAGEGIATRKWDGTCCMIKDGVFYKRYDAWTGKRAKKPPEGFIPAQEPDEKTGHWPGWVKVGDGPEDEWHKEGYYNILRVLFPPSSHSDLNAIICPPNGTYELCGPKINGNNEGLDKHILIKHAEDRISLRFDYYDLKAFFIHMNTNFSHPNSYIGGLPRGPALEGIVWHHPDGRMVKIKARDFGIPWPREVK